MDADSLSRRERNKLKSRRQIMDAGLQLLERQGVEATTIDQIAEAADVSRGTFFNYFPTKESLLSAIALEELHDLDPSSSSGTGTVAHIYALMRALMTDSVAFFQVTRYILLDAMLRPTEATSPGTHLEAMLTALVQQAQSQGEIRANVDPAAAAVALLGVYLGAFYRMPSAGPESRQAAVARVEATIGLLFDGIAGPAYTRP